ncbi:MAG: hypothetical protein QG673_1350 [Pseudomonadota bacterium]|nr:hypothetical protein [Pseudomonadota bacterium]
MYSNLFLFAVVVLTIHLIPGPTMMYCINSSLNSGKSSGVAAAIGAEIGNSFYILLTGLGLSALILSSTTIYSGIKTLGSIYLIYLAYKSLPSKKTKNTQISNTTTASKTSKLLGGVMINITNPKILLFFITLLPQFVPADQKDVKIFFLLGLAFSVSSFMVSLFVVFFSHNIKHRLKNSPKISKTISYAPSIIFLLAGTFSLI